MCDRFHFPASIIYTVCQCPPLLFNFFQVILYSSAQCLGRNDVMNSNYSIASSCFGRLSIDLIWFNNNSKIYLVMNPVSLLLLCYCPPFHPQCLPWNSYVTQFEFTIWWLFLWYLPVFYLFKVKRACTVSPLNLLIKLTVT